MNSKPTVTTILCLLFLLFLLGTASLSTVYSAAPQEKPGNMNFHFTVAETDKTLQGRPAMISLIRDGQMVEQQETPLPNGRTIFSLPTGVYDVRVEAEGMVTEVKRGVHLFPDTLDLFFVVHAGKGVHIVEYATGALSREEVAARLAKLEAEVAQLQKSLPPK